MASAFCGTVKSLCINTPSIAIRHDIPLSDIHTNYIGHASVRGGCSTQWPDGVCPSSADEDIPSRLHIRPR